MNIPNNIVISVKSEDKSIRKKKKEKRCCSPSAEFKTKLLINESYDLVAQKNNLLKSDNGNKFYEVLTKHRNRTL
jgi:hypothetical protein